ncbi:MAG: hypothetical protein K8T89_19990 [Planctomycetes bacterium]|nr:hypothetical protein [Planctomycetota bacterium]
MRSLYRAVPTITLAVCAASVLQGCGSSDETKAVGKRLAGFQKIVAVMQSKPEGKYSANEVPAEIRPRGLVSVYVDGRGSCALEFVSNTAIDLNPAFVYIGFDAPDQEAAARQICGKAALVYRSAFEESGWHRATGP